MHIILLLINLRFLLTELSFSIQSPNRFSELPTPPNLAPSSPLLLMQSPNLCSEAPNLAPLSSLLLLHITTLFHEASNLIPSSMIATCLCSIVNQSLHIIHSLRHSKLIPSVFFHQIILLSYVKGMNVHWLLDIFLI